MLFTNIKKEIEDLAQNKGGINLNIQRWTSALLGFPLIAAVLIFGNELIIDIVFTIMAMMCLHEYFSCFKNAKPIKEIGYVSALIIPLIHILEPSQFIYLLLIVPITVVWIFLRVIVSNMKINVYDAAITLLGIIYIVGFMIFLPLIIDLKNGKLLVWYAIFTAWGTDIFAYLVGKAFGKHKFTEVSPKKSIEGCVAGIIGSVFLGIIYTYVLNTYMNFNISYVYISAISMFLSIIVQIGDLSASTIKRYTGIKDFSNLIPGHGGMLDRLDSVIFVAPFAFLFLTIM